MSEINKIVIAIESAISGGSISLFADGEESDHMVGAAGVSRAEDLLPNIDVLLKRNGAAVADLAEIVVTAGPGSFTGIRIGIATGLGLARSIGIRCRQISLLSAAAHMVSEDGDFMIAFPVGRETICWQRFERKSGNTAAVSEPLPTAFADLSEKALSENVAGLYVSGALFEKLPVLEGPHVHDLGNDLARYLAIAAIRTDIQDSHEPLFISKAN
jgi:tRNA threonylcarbamoyl adenosine modification protein YeaZ